MLVSTNWLNDFLTSPLLPEERAEIGEKLTLHTAEVDGVQEEGAHLANITVAQLTEIEPHPEADKLRLATVKIGEGASQRVVCGAPNLQVGMKVAYAPLGTSFPNGLTLEAKKIRGVVSEGMLCSAAELGVGDDHDGILELDAEATIGIPLTEYFGITPDLIIDIDNKAITNRPDLWGHEGIARECAAIFSSNFSPRCGEEWRTEQEQLLPSTPSPVTVQVDSSSCCRGYCGIAMSGVTVEESPPWMQQRLRAVGLRPVNNLVDIGNYVMLEIGGPLHFFDLAEIRGSEISIRRATEGEELLLLDGEKISLTEHDTVVADAERALVLGGIMGGENSGISEKTQEIFIEAANWERSAIRKSSSRHGVRSDSSQRFEKGLDPLQMRATLLRAVELVRELCPQAEIRGNIAYDGEDLSALTAPIISCSPSRINRLLGTDYSPSTMRETLEQLDFQVEEQNESLLVAVPSFRATREFEHEADVAEEIGRIQGYSSIVPTPPTAPIQPVRRAEIHRVERTLREVLPLHGRLLEIQSYPLVGEKLLQEMQWEEEQPALQLKNPLSTEQSQMRTSLVPSLLEAMRLNAKHFESFRLFEIGRTYHRAHRAEQSPSSPEEQRQLSLGVYSSTGEDPYRPLLDILEVALEALSVRFQIQETQEKFPHALLPLKWGGRHPYRSRTVMGYGNSLGEITELHPLFLRSLKMKGRAAIALLSLDPIAERAEAREKGKRDQYTPLSRFPSSTFDCTVVAEPKGELEGLLSVLRRFKAKEVQERSIVAEFAPTPEERYVTVRLVFGKPEGTLSGEQVKQLETDAVKHLEKNGFLLKAG
ncbi:phenylalanine--tRNA ligase subunit beta [bacterium]|nr:phenylalanine--tRNA ligase subunit beta [bacterium]